MRITFLGLGRMGMPMAQNLLGLGHTVTVYNRTPGRARSLAAMGAKDSTSIADAVKDAEVAITMLAGDEAVKEVVLGPAGLLQHLPHKAIHLCMCTIEFETSATMAAAHTKAGQGYVAAPVFGRPDSALSRQVWIVAGGPEPHVNRCRPIFEALGKGYSRVGYNAPLAHALKLGSITLSVAMELAVSELIAYAKKAGLAPPDYLRFLNTAMFRSHMVDNYACVPARPSFDPEDQTLELAASELLLQQARVMGVDVPVADLLNVRLQAANARGWGEQDLADLALACQTETGFGGTPAFLLKFHQPDGPEASISEPPTPAPPISVELKDADSQSDQDFQHQLPEAGKEASAQGEPSQANELRRLAEPEYKPPIDPFPAMNGEIHITLDLDQTSHFELLDGRVWAWSQGNRYATQWKKFAEVELAFNQILFLLIKRHILLRPEAVLNIRSTFGGGAKARVGENLELDVSRSAAKKLKELLGF